MNDRRSIAPIHNPTRTDIARSENQTILTHEDLFSRQSIATQVIVNNPNNSYGTAGFVLSILGLLSCGLLMPIGFLLSFIGVFRQPRGFAVGGILISLLSAIPLCFIAIPFIMAPSIMREMNAAMEEAKSRMEAEKAMNEPVFVDPPGGLKRIFPDSVLVESAPEIDVTPEPIIPPAKADTEHPTIIEEPVVVQQPLRPAIREIRDPRQIARDRIAKEIEDSFRIWTSADGKFTTEARILMVRGETITLVKRDGKEVKVTLDRLSDDDKTFLKNRK